VALALALALFQIDAATTIAASTRIGSHLKKKQPSLTQWWLSVDDAAIAVDVSSQNKHILKSGCY
jgi:hypothetical protein